MLRRIPRRATFLLERFIVRGPFYRLLMVAGILALLSLAGGVVVWAAGELEFGKAVWWAFLRLSDPGYLGDDEGALKRTVSTVLTVLGYVVFLGALVAIMTQWLNARMRHLEQGLTPIAQKHHLLVLGWTNRTPAILRELLASAARVKRFLRRRGAMRGLNIVVLAEDVDAGLVQDLRDRLGGLWDRRRITLRTGTPLRLEHLRRVDFSNAAAIVLPAADFAESDADTADTRAVKVLMSIAEYRGANEDERDFPLVVGEVFDARRVGIAYEAYKGPLEVLSSDEVVARLLAQTVRHPGLSYVHREILAYGDGNELYVREVEGFEGAYVADLAPGFPQAIVLGLVRPRDGGFTALLDPSAGPKVRKDDRLVLLAPDWDATEPLAGFRPEVDEEALRPVPRAEVMAERRLLVLGWSHRVPALLKELESYQHERFEVVVASMVSVAEREAAIEQHGFGAQRVTVRHRELDYTVPGDLAKVEPGSFHNVVMVASDWLPSGEDSDARTILGHLLVRQLSERPRPRLLVELTDEENVRLFRGKGTEVLVTPLLLSHMLAQVALRRELRVVFDELFGSGGAEIFFRPAADYGLTGREATFAEVQDAAGERGEVALGLRIGAERRRGGGVRLNPPRDERFALEDRDEVVVLTAY